MKARIVRTITILAVCLCLKGNLSAETIDSATAVVDRKMACQQIEQAIDHLFQTDSKNFTAAQSNAAAEGLYLLYALDPNDDGRLRKLKDGLRRMLATLQRDQRNPARLVALADQFNLVDEEALKAIAPSRGNENNALFSAVQIHVLLGNGQIAKARNVALNINGWKTFSLVEEEGLRDLFDIMMTANETKPQETATVIWSLYSNGRPVSLLYAERLLFAIRQLNSHVLGTNEERAQLLKLRIQLSHALVHDASLLNDATNGTALEYDIEVETKADAAALSQKDKDELNKEMAVFQTDKEEARRLNRQWLSLIIEDGKTSIMPSLIRDGQIDVINKKNSGTSGE